MFNYKFWGINSLSGIDNMALEELFLADTADKRSAHLRFYDFNTDSIILGYGQATDVVKNWSSVNVVRRPSGGSHVFVGGNTLAYSVIIPRDGSFVNHQDFRVFYADKVADAFERVGISGITRDHNVSTIMH